MSSDQGCHGTENVASSGRLFHAVRVLLGGGLLLAAGLKADGFRLDPLAQDSFLSSPRLLIATIEVEIILGLFLLCGLAPRAAWASALAFFSLLIPVSLFIAVSGQASCGCLGRVSVNPWITFAIDVAVITTLALCRPPPESRKRWPSALDGIVRILLGAAGIFLVIATGFFLIVQSPADALARLRGESMTVSPDVVYLGEGTHREERAFTVRLQNHTDHPIRVLGGTATCSCRVVEELPITLEPGQSREISVRALLHGAAGFFKESYVFLTDDPIQPRVIASWTGRVVVESSDR
jgi:hypothetical protein